MHIYTAETESHDHLLSKYYREAHEVPGGKPGFQRLYVRPTGSGPSKPWKWW